MHIKSSFPLLPCFEVGSIFFSTLNIPLFQQLKAKGGSRMWLKVKMTFGRRSEVVHWDLVASSLFPRRLHVWIWEATGHEMG